MTPLLRRLLLGQKDRAEVPDYISHEPVTQPEPWWDCHTDTKVDREANRPTTGWRGTTAECADCKSIHKVVDGHIPKHTPADPTEVYCPMGHPYFPDTLQPVYIGRHAPPTCQTCAEADGIVDEDGVRHHTAPGFDTHYDMAGES